MITRQEYMADSANLHHKYYSQFVIERTRQQVLDNIGIDKLRLSSDPHLNDVKIPFNAMGRGGGWWWDTVVINTKLLKELGECSSPSTHTCVGKAAARQLLEETS